MLLRTGVLALGSVATVLALPDPTYNAKFTVEPEYPIQALGQESLHSNIHPHTLPQFIPSETIYQVLSNIQE
jgi:hypothetical protein